jgi:Tfp pilus assembly protein PilO
VNTKKRKVSPVTLSVLIGLAGVLVLALGMFLLVLPQKHKAASIDQEIADTQTQITQARLAAKPKTPQPIQAANLFKLVKAMPDNADMPGILLQLNQTAHDAGIEFDAITPQAILTTATPVQVPIDLEFAGNFYDLNDFLFRLRSLVAVRGGALQANGRLFSVDAIEFAEGTDGFPDISAKLSVRAYVYGTNVGATPTTTTPAAPATPTPTATTPAETTSTDTAAVASGATG